MCGSMADIQSAAAEIRRGKKDRTNHSMKIYMVSLFHRATIKNKVAVFWNTVQYILAVSERMTVAFCTVSGSPVRGVCVGWLVGV